MADEEKRGDVLRSLGVKPRRSAESRQDEGQDEDESASADQQDDSPPAKEGGVGILGIRRRKAGDAPQRGRSPRGERIATDDPRSFLEGKLGSDETAVVLANHFKVRPGLAPLLPERLWELTRTHGYYLGDGRPERKVTIGWQPALVLFTIPPYPDGMPKPTASREYRLPEPGLHSQPEMAEDGFLVGADYNKLGDCYLFVVFKDDGSPLQTEQPRTKRRR